jgi:hypothetical protein
MNDTRTMRPREEPAVETAVPWDVTFSPAAPATGTIRRVGSRMRVALAETAGGQQPTADLLSTVEDHLPPDLTRYGPSWASALTLLDLSLDGRATVACYQSPPVLVMSADVVDWLSPLLPLSGARPGECPLAPGDRLLAMTPSFVAHLDPRLLRTLVVQAPRMRCTDDLADLLITRVDAEELRGWRRQCAYGFVIVTRRSG